MVDARIVGQAIQGSARTGLGIVRAVHQSREPTLNNGPRAHRAGFEGDIKDAVIKPPGTQNPTGLRQGEPLRMGRGVVKSLPKIVRLRDHTTFAGHNRSDGNFPDPGRLMGQRQRETHGPFIAGTFHDCVGIRSGSPVSSGFHFNDREPECKCVRVEEQGIRVGRP